MSMAIERQPSAEYMWVNPRTGALKLNAHTRPTAMDVGHLLQRNHWSTSSPCNGCRPG